MLTLPGAGDDVIIDGYEITVSAFGSEPQPVNSITIKADTRDDHAYLRINNGAGLSVSNNVTVISPNNRDKNIYLYVYGTLDIGGNLNFERSNNFTRYRYLQLYINGGSVSVSGNFNYNYYRAANNEDYDDVFMANAATFRCANVNFRKDLGGQININMSGSSRWRVSGNFIVDENGGDDFEFVMTESSLIDIGGNFTAYCDGAEDLQWYMSQTAGTNHFYVAGNFLIDHNSGENIDFALSNSAQITTGGDFAIDWSGSRADDSDINFTMTNNALIDIEGSLEINMNEIVRNTCDIRIGMDYNSKIEVGVDNNLMLENTTIAISDGDVFYFKLDRDASFIVHGQARFLQDGDGLFYIDLNQNADGTTTDAILQVDGRFRINKTDGDAFRIFAQNYATIDVGDDFIVAITGHDAGWQNDEIQLTNDATINVGRSFSYTLNVPNENNLVLDLDQNAGIYVNTVDAIVSESSTISIIDGYRLDIDLDENSKFYTVGDLNINQSGNENFYIDLNAAPTTSVTAGSEIRASGNFNIRKDDGDAFRLRLQANSDINIGGDFIVNTIGHDAGWQNDEIEMNDNSGIDVDGSFSFSLNVPNENSIYLDMNDKSTFYVGVDNGSLAETTTLNLTNGYSLYFELDENAVFETYGNMTVNFAGDEYLDFALNGNADGGVIDAQLNIDGNWTINKTDGDRFRIRLNEHSDINVGGNFSYTSTNHDSGPWDGEHIILTNDGRFDINGDFTFDMNDNSNQNDLVLDLDNNGILDIAGDALMQMTQGESFYIDMDGDSRMNIGGNLECTSSCNGTMDLEFNANANGVLADAQLNIGGDWTIIKTNGDQFNLELNEDADIKIEGNFSYTATNHDAGMWDNDRLILNDNSTIDTDGNFTFSTNDPNRQNDLIIDLNNNSVLSMGTDLTNSSAIYMKDGYRMRIRLDDNARLYASGDLNIGFNGNDTWQICDLRLNSDAGTTSEMYVTGNLTLNNDYNQDLFEVRLYQNGSLLDVDGNIDITSALTQGRVGFRLDNASELHIGGSFLRNATPNRYGYLDARNTSTVYYDGNGSAGQQKVAENYGDGTDAFNYQYVVINNTWGTVPQLTMEGTTKIIANRDLKFTDGIVDATLSKYFIIQDNATVSDASDNSYVDGYIHKIGNDAFTFPVGDTDNDDGTSTRYAPATLTPYSAGSSAPSTNTEFSCAYVNVNPHAVGDTALKEAPIHHLSKEEYWLIDDVVRNSTWDVTLSWGFPRSGGIDNVTEIRVAHWDGSIWENYGNNATTGTTTDGTIKVNNISNFSPFTLASVTRGNPLPVSFIDFIANTNGESVFLKWTTLTEINNDYFTVQRSFDAVNFEDISFVNGAGSNNTAISYYDTDEKPFSGISYYRIKQTDYDGKYSFSAIKSININNKTATNNSDVNLIVYPNPVNIGNILNVDYNSEIDNIDINIFDISGRYLNADVSYNFNNASINTNTLSTGVYFLIIKIDNKIFKNKFIVK